MVQQTFIKGKDACLEESIDKMQKRLVQAGFDIEETAWLEPVPNIFSVHIRDTVQPALFTNGKGASRKATLASALGEFFERLETNYFFSDFYLAPVMALRQEENDPSLLYFPDEKLFALQDYRQCLNEKIWQVYDPDQAWQAEDLLSLNDDDDQIRCLKLHHAISGEETYFPMSVLSNLYASNGLCAGNTLLEAQVQGLSEVFERWVKKRILTENLCLPEVPDSVLAKFPSILTSIDALKAEGLDVSVRDASLGGCYPVMNVTLFDVKSGQCFASFGAHPMFEVALERTLTESLQGRKLNALDGFQTPVFDAYSVAEDENIENHFIDSSGLIHAKFVSHNYDFAFSEWNFEGATEAQWQYLLDIVSQEGAEVYLQPCDYFGVKACRVIVPGMSEIYPFEELLDNNQNLGRYLRQALMSLNTLEDDEALEALLAVCENFGFSDHQGVANIIGLLPDANSYWKKMKIVELKMWCLLALKDYDAAYDQLQDCQYFVDDESMKLDLKALAFALEILSNERLSDYPLSVQKQLFGETRMERVWRWINGESGFAELSLGEALFEGTENHKKLLAVYERVLNVRNAAGA